MTTKEIKDLIKLVSESEIKEFKLSKEGFEIKIRTTKDQLAPTYVAAQLWQQRLSVLPL